MKIAFVVQDMFQQGMQAATAAVIRQLVAEGHKVDLLVSSLHVTWGKEGGRVAFKVPDEVKWIVMPHSKARQNILFLARYLRKTDADVVIAVWGVYQKAIRIASLGLRKRPLLVKMDHGTYDAGWTPGWKYKFWISCYDRFFFVNKLSRENFLKVNPTVPPNHVMTVYNPVVDAEFLRKKALGPSHPWLKEKKYPTFVSAGAYEPYKDHMTLLRAVNEVIKSRPIRVVIFGRGSLESTYLKYIRENHLEDYVSIAGSSDRLPGEMVAADGFILSSNWESFGIVLVEALACNLPTISTDVVWGPREILDNGKYGRLVPIGDSIAMAEAILKQLDEPRKPVPDEAWNSYVDKAIAQRFIEGINGKGR